MFKRITALLLCTAMMLTLGSCGMKKKIEDKVAEKLTEEIIEKAAGKGTDVDLEEGKITVKGEDGQEVTIGGGEWPKDGAGKLIPQFKKGTIVSTMNSEQACMVTIEGVEADDYKKYVEEIKDKGFIHDVSEYSGGGITVYEAHNDDGAMVGVNYTSDQKTVQIIVQAKTE